MTTSAGPVNWKALRSISLPFQGLQTRCDSHHLIRWAGSSGLQDAVVERLFERYFTKGADIGSGDELIDVARYAGMDVDLVTDLFKRGEDLELIRKEDDSARAKGVNAVPCFVFAKKYVVFGAQEPDAYIELFDHMAREAETEPVEGEMMDSGA